MNRLRSLIQDTFAIQGSRTTRWDAASQISWKAVGLLAATILLPFGWILPVARLARAWVAIRRGPGR